MSVVKTHAGGDTTIHRERLHHRKRNRATTILFVTRGDEFGGAERHLLELIRTMAGSEIRLSILCLGKDFYSSRLSMDQSAYVNVRSEDVDSAWDWFRLFRDIQPDVVVFIRCWLWCFPWHVCFVGRLAGIPRRVTIVHLPPSLVRNERDRSMLDRWRRMRHSLSFGRLAICSSTTICVSNAIRNSLVTNCRFPATRTLTIHNGVSPCEFSRNESSGLTVRASLGLSSEDFVLVCAARLVEQKRIDVLLLSMARVLSDGVRCKCIIAGDGPLRNQLTKQAVALDLSGHVCFVGFQEDVRPYLHAADAFVLTSQREGLPLSILEAMACELPCVVTNVDGNVEAISHKIHGLVVSSGSVTEVADAISYLVKNPDERAYMSRMARERVSEAFDIEDRMAEIKRLILN